MTLPMKRIILLAAAAALVAGCAGNAGKEPVDYVNPYVGNISHLLVPCFPTHTVPHKAPCSSELP